MKLIHKKVTEEIYGNTYHILVGSNDDANKWVRRRFKDKTALQFDEDYACLVHLIGHTYLMFFNTNAWNDTTFIEDTIAHECFHATIQGLHIHGVALDVDHQEPHAYYVGWLVREVHALRKKKNKFAIMRLLAPESRSRD